MAFLADGWFGGGPVAGGASVWQRWRQKVQAKILFGQALSCFPMTMAECEGLDLGLSLAVM